MKTLVVYLMSDPDTPELAEAAVEGGADVIELGFPFSDPLADGPVIRAAAERALARGMRTRACLECLAHVRQRVDVPLIPMTYASLLRRTAGSDSLPTRRRPARPA
jgi:tryptophan synthase alpha chain